MAKELSDFGKAFAAARKSRLAGGDDTFEFGGKKYHSYQKGEEKATKYADKTQGAPGVKSSPAPKKSNDMLLSSDVEPKKSIADAIGERVRADKAAYEAKTPSTETQGPSLKDSDTRYSPESRRSRAQAAQDKSDYNQAGYASGGRVRGVGAAVKGFGRGKIT